MTENLISDDGLAWSPDGDEIWFTATHEGLSRAVFAVDLSGKERLLARVPGTLTILDMARDGRVLLKREANRQEVKAFIDGEPHGGSFPGLISPFPPRLAMTERLFYLRKSEKRAALPIAIYIRGTDGSPAVRLGDWKPAGLSPDGNWVLAITHETPAQLFLLPTKAGAPRALTNDSIDHFAGGMIAGWKTGGLYRKRTGKWRTALRTGSGRRKATRDQCGRGGR